uniref:Uncharacterized protein n=1 Tax=Rhizophora mucronata TaxID=61149 RepID=A0A2P2ILE5_RHIMU
MFAHCSFLSSILVNLDLVDKQA